MGGSQSAVLCKKPQRIAPIGMPLVSTRQVTSVLMLSSGRCGYLMGVGRHNIQQNDKKG